MSDSHLRRQATMIVNNYAAGCGGAAIATGPVPGTSVILTGIEAKMAYDVARVYGYQPTIGEAGSTVSTLLAASTGLKHLAVEMATLIPVIGWWVVKPAIAAGAAKAIGQLIIGHYEQKYRGDHGKAMAA